MMKNLIALVTGAGLGAGAMYVLDPDAGRRRRALARDKMILAQRKTREVASSTARDLKNRTLGLVAEARSRFSASDMGDEVVRERVRSKLGFLVRHPSAIDVQVANGQVVLNGPVLSDEVEQLISGIRSVRGIQDVENRLEVHAEPGSVPALQGDKPKPTGEPIDILQQRWSPATRFLIGALGALFFYSANRYAKTGATLPALALGLLAYVLGAEDIISSSALKQRQAGRNGHREELTAGWNI